MKKSITTKTGDKGMTSLLGGGRIKKDHVIVRACAELDTLCSFLALARTLSKEVGCKKLLESIQKDVGLICSEIAASKRFAKKLKIRIGPDSVKRLEDKIGDLERKVKLKACFSLLNENLISNILDLSRTMARKAEIHLVTLKRKRLLINDYVLIYLNRLSDLLYLLSRSSDKFRRKVKV
ncbi:MAG: ATP:cob(I)alamin adenosyltransferase [Candidatus Omnitrophota bacterium]